MKNIGSGYQGPPGGMKVSVVKASQLPKASPSPKSTPCRTGGGNKGAKAHWRILRKIPQPENHLSRDFAGILAKNDNAEYPIAGCEAPNVNSPLLQTVV